MTPLPGCEYTFIIARSLEGCCSIQLSYGTIGKFAAQRTICAAKIGKVFHNSPRRSKKSHIRHGGNTPSMRKRQIDRTSGNTPQKPRSPAQERHPGTTGIPSTHGRRHRRQRQQRETTGDGRQTAGRRREAGGKQAGSRREAGSASATSRTGAGPGRTAAKPRQYLPTCRKSAFRPYFSANYFAGRNILPTFAGLKAQSG